MGRLDDIIARNQNPKRSNERLTVGIGISLFLLLVIGLMVLTDLGIPPDPARPASIIDPADPRVDDIQLGTPTAR